MKLRVVTITLSLLALSCVVSCSKKPPEDTETTSEKKDDKEKSKDEAKKDDPAPAASADDESAEEVEAVPVAADFAEKAQATIKPTDDYKKKLDDLENEIGKE